MIQPMVNAPFEHRTADLLFRVGNRLICFSDLHDRSWADRSSLTKKMPETPSLQTEILETCWPLCAEYTAPPTALLVQFIIALFRVSIGTATTISENTSGICTGQKVSNLNSKLSRYYIYPGVEKIEMFYNREEVGMISYRLNYLFSWLL